MHDRRAVRNHLDCVHAIALANLAELAGNVALAYSLPDDARFIVSGMEIEYIEEGARHDHRDRRAARSRAPRPAPQYDVPVTLRDASGEEVARAILHSLVGPKPGSPSDRGDVN